MKIACIATADYAVDFSTKRVFLAQGTPPLISARNKIAVKELLQKLGLSLKTFTVIS